MYNQALAHVKYNRFNTLIKIENGGNIKLTIEPIKLNFFELRNQFVIAKNNPRVKSWEEETPKDVRAGVIKDLVTAYKACFTNKKQGNITKFDLQFRKKKFNYSMVIPKSTLKIKNNKLSLYSSYLKSGMKFSENYEINHDCRLKENRGKWFLYVPVKRKIKVNSSTKTCAIDPGVRTFVTTYSTDKTMSFDTNRLYINSKFDKLSKIQSTKSKSSVKRHVKRMWFRLSNLIDDMHYRVIHSLKEYGTIYLPTFESQELVSKLYGKTNKRDLLTLQHYKFKMRLKESGIKVIDCTEEYTSKTCGNCGELNNNLGSSKLFHCPSCDIRIDRDVNAARNIYIKTGCS